MRFGTNAPHVFYEAVAARLAEILSQDLEPAHTDPEAYHQNKCRELLDVAIAKQTPLLLIIDGLDEALGASFDASWFPRQAGRFLRLLVSARLEVGDRDATGWAGRLNWNSVRTHDLGILYPDDIADLLRRPDPPMNMLASRSEIARKLYKLSEGEPLLLRLYAEDLWKRDEETAWLTIEDLDRIKPGLNGYFDDWMRRQRNAWRIERKEGAMIDEQTLNGYLVVLACAYGPLTAEELSRLVREAHGLAAGLRVEDALPGLNGRGSALIKEVPSVPWRSPSERKKAPKEKILVGS
jgi:hypothetical protein